MARTPAAVLAALLCCACSTSSSSPAVDAGADARAALVDARTTCDDAATACDPFLSCGCAAGDKCTAVESGLGCAPAGGALAGESCSTDASCAPATTCIAYAGETSCHAFCDEVHPCATGACYIRTTDRSHHVVGTLCGPTCSLLAADCSAGLACYPADEAPDGDHGICLAPGSGTQGDSCTAMTDCASGYACVAPSGTASSICARICSRTGGPPACEGSTTCRRFQSSSGDSQTGVCLP